MRVRLLFFASLAERAGRRTEEIDCPAGTTPDSLWASLAARPAFAGVHRPAFARNAASVSADVPLEEGDEVAFLPPVSGG
jgi:sulfur-carrier protein